MPKKRPKGVKEVDGTIKYWSERKRVAIKKNKGCGIKRNGRKNHHRDLAFKILNGVQSVS